MVGKIEEKQQQPKHINKIADKNNNRADVHATHTHMCNVAKHIVKRSNVDKQQCHHRVYVHAYPMMNNKTSKWKEEKKINNNNNNNNFTLIFSERTMFLKQFLCCYIQTTKHLPIRICLWMPVVLLVISFTAMTKKMRKRDKKVLLLLLFNLNSVWFITCSLRICAHTPHTYNCHNYMRNWCTLNNDVRACLPLAIVCPYKVLMCCVRHKFWNWTLFRIYGYITIFGIFLPFDHLNNFRYMHHHPPSPHQSIHIKSSAVKDGDEWCIARLFALILHAYIVFGQYSKLFFYPLFSVFFLLILFAHRCRRCRRFFYSLSIFSAYILMRPNHRFTCVDNICIAVLMFAIGYYHWKLNIDTHTQIKVIASRAIYKACRIAISVYKGG